MSIQVWAESLRDKQVRRIVERGLRQREALTEALRNAQLRGELPAELETDSV